MLFNKESRMNIMKKVRMLLSTFFLLSLLGCSSLNEKQAEQMVNLLEEKYEEEFVVTHIGQRYGTATNDTVTTYVHPKENENLSFKAIMTKDGQLVGDGYIPVLISDQFNDMMKSELEPLGIESETYTFIMKARSAGETDKSITIEEYVEKYQPAYFSAHMIVKDTGDVKGEQFEQALLKAYGAAQSTTYQIGIRIIPADEYDEAAKAYRKLSVVKDSWFSDYDLVDEIDAVADGNGYNFIHHSDPRYQN